MWPFRASSSPFDDVIQETVLPEVALLKHQMAEVQKLLSDVPECVRIVDRLEKACLSLDRQLKQLVGVRDDDMARVNAAIEQIRGIASGPKGGRPPRIPYEVQELGQKLVSAMQNPEDLARLIGELQQLQAQAGAQQAFGGFARTNSPV